MLRRKWTLWSGICLLFGAWLVADLNAAPQITARDGILYQDGKPCFLVGGWGPCGYSDAIGFKINASFVPSYYGYLETVPGKKGKGLKANFLRTEKPVSRWLDTMVYPPDWAEKKYQAVKFWVKGDGSKITFSPNIGYWIQKERRSKFGAQLDQFSLEGAEWKEITIPLEGKHDQLEKANYLSLSCSKTNEAFSFIVDEIRAVGADGGEEVLCDYDSTYGESILYFSHRGEKDEFKDDPVYKALRNDPLYEEISGTNFQAIGMNTYHLSSASDCEEVALLKGGEKDSPGEAIFCKKLNGMPIVPGFIFTWGAYHGSEAKKWAQSLGFPLSVLQCFPDGSPVGSYMAICFEDPLGNKLFKTVWQRAARRLLTHGANIYAYELINENSGFYYCGCAHNQEMFINRLKDKCRDQGVLKIERLNNEWGTDYGDFETIRKQIPKLGRGTNKIKGLTVAWNKFIEDRYVEMLQQGGQWIHEVEDELGKPHALMGQMGYPNWDFLGFGGADMYKMAKGLDTIQTEGGVKFGSGIYSGEINPLTVCMASKGAYGHQLALDLAAAACPDKPIINTEHYVMRYKGGREPTTKADLITTLWEEFVRGASAVHTYAWFVSYASREDALADGLRDQNLLSPYVYPRETLNGYKEVNEEIGRVADIVMKRPRLGRNAESAVLFSRPTARYLIGKPSWIKDWKKETPFYRSHETFYTYFMENHYPRRFIYEEQLAEGKADKYRVLLVPHSDNIYPETMKYLTEYVENGGTLVCFGDAFRYDEYGNDKEKERSCLLGLERIKTNSFTEDVELKDFGKVKVTANRKIVPSTAEVILAFPQSKEPFLTLNKTGKGGVYYVNADTFNLDGDLINPLLDYVCQEVKLNPPVKVSDPEGNKEAGIEAEVIPGKDGELVLYLVNWKPYQDRVVRVSLPGLDEGRGYYLVDVVKDCLYTREGKETLTGKEFGEGIYLLLPAEERVVLLLTGKKYSAANKPVELLSKNAARELNEKNMAKLKAELEKEAADMARKKEIVFGLRGRSNQEEVTECIKSAAGDAVAGITLKSSNTSCDIKINYDLREGEDSVLTYLLVFKDTIKEEEKNRVLADVLKALLNKYGARIKIISGWKEADLQMSKPEAK